MGLRLNGEGFGILVKGLGFLVHRARGARPKPRDQAVQSQNIRARCWVAVKELKLT